MKRRDFITLIGGATMAWPLSARAQQPAMPVIGFLHSASARTAAQLLSGFIRGLSEMGFTENGNTTIEYRWGEGQHGKLTALAAELVRRQVSVIATGGGLVTAIAAKEVTATIPIVFSGGSNPVAAGLVVSLNKPGTNVTGILNFAAELTAKRLELLRVLAPTATVVGVLYNPDNPEAAFQIHEIETAAHVIGLKVQLVSASPQTDLAMAMTEVAQRAQKALFVANDPSFAARRYRLATLITQHGIPAIHPQRQYAEAGGLMSYGTNFADVYRQAGNYVGRILKGEKPADLPVMQPAQFELVINLQTAKTQRLEIPPTLLALADEVIE